jgi:uncharacterized membrane protein YkoI
MRYTILKNKFNITVFAYILVILSIGLIPNGLATEDRDASKWNLNGTESILPIIINGIKEKNGLSMTDAIISAQNHGGKDTFVTNSLLTQENGFVVYDVTTINNSDVRRLIIDAGSGQILQDSPFHYKVVPIDSNGNTQELVFNSSNMTNQKSSDLGNNTSLPNSLPFLINHTETSNYIDIVNAIGIAESKVSNNSTTIFAMLNANEKEANYEIYMVDDNQNFYYQIIDAKTGNALSLEGKSKDQFGQTLVLLNS